MYVCIYVMWFWVKQNIAPYSLPLPLPLTNITSAAPYKHLDEGGNVRPSQTR